MLLRELEGCVHHVLRQAEQLGAAGNEFLQGQRVARIVLGLHFGVCISCCAFENVLVLCREGVVGLVADIQRKLRATFPPGGVGVELGHLVETELLIVVRTDPFGSINGAFFQCLINLAAGDVLRNTADAGQNTTAKAADTHLQAVHVGQRLDFLAVPATHLGAGVAHREIEDVVLRVELTHQFQTVALIHPGRGLAGIKTERDGAVEGKGFVLAEEVIGGGVSAFHSALLNCVNHAKCRDQFAARVDGNLELAASHFLDFGGKGFGSAVNGVQRLREAGGQTPADGFTTGDDSRSCRSSGLRGGFFLFAAAAQQHTGTGSGTQRSGGQKLASFHELSPRF